jgi:hypothetical protein
MLGTVSTSVLKLPGGTGQPGDGMVLGGERQKGVSTRHLLQNPNRASLKLFILGPKQMETHSLPAKPESSVSFL